MSFSIKIGNKEFSNPTNFKLSLKHNSLASSFSFSTLLDPTNAEHRLLFKPFTYTSCQVYFNNQLLLTGYIATGTFKETSKPVLTPLTGFSRTAVLVDSSIPISTYPLQHDGKTIREIAELLLKPFGIGLVVNNAPEADEVIETSTAKATDTVHAYLNTICSQKNLVLTHNAWGDLVINKAATSKPLALINGEVYNEATIKCDGSKMHNLITVIRQSTDEVSNGGEEEINNPFVSSSTRPLVKEQSSGHEHNLSQTAAAILAAELRNINFSFKFDKWTINGQLLKPAQVYQLYSQELFMRRATNVFLETVTFSGTPTKETATVSAVLPEVYTNVQPVNFF